MIRRLILAFALASVPASLLAQMDTQTRRDFISACMFSGGFTVEGKEPDIAKKNDTIDVDRTVESWIKLFPKPEDKLKAGQEIRACLQQILDANNYKREQSRIVPRDNLFAELALDIDPSEYAKGIVCKRSDIRQQLMISYQLRQLGKNINPNVRKRIDAGFFQFFGLNEADPLTKAIMNLDPNGIDCNVERICEVRGSVPVEVLTDTMYIFETPMRQVKVMEGNCQNKIGFINERFINF